MSRGRCSARPRMLSIDSWSDDHYRARWGNFVRAEHLRTLRVSAFGADRTARSRVRVFVFVSQGSQGSERFERKQMTVGKIVKKGEPDRSHKCDVPSIWNVEEYANDIGAVYRCSEGHYWHLTNQGPLGFQTWSLINQKRVPRFLAEQGLL